MIMPIQCRTIESFFPPSSSADTSPQASEGDPISSSTPASTAEHNPRVVYEDVDIGSIIPGPQAVRVTGRIVNFFGQQVTSKLPMAAKGCMKIIVKDDTGAVSVRLYHAQRSYALRLGQLVAIRTPHVSDGLSASLSCNSAPLFISIFPERDRSCDFATINETSRTRSLCRTPLGCDASGMLQGLVTLKIYLDSEISAQESKLVLCVKRLSQLKKVKTKWGESHVLRLTVFDDTAASTLTLWGACAISAASWPSPKPILLLSYPACNKALADRPQLSLGRDSHLDLDPDINEATFLRKFAAQAAQRERIDIPIPAGLFDVQSLYASNTRVLYSLADLDDAVRDAPCVPLIGFLSVVILNFKMATLRARSMLCVGEHCGVSTFANTLRATCSQCDTMFDAGLNPGIVGTVADETGSVAPGRLLWTARAWVELLGRSTGEFVVGSADLLKYMEMRMAWLRYTLVVGWPGEDVGRLCVLSVRK